MKSNVKLPLALSESLGTEDRRLSRLRAIKHVLAASHSRIAALRRDLLVGALMLSTMVAEGAEWSRFRGPNGSGVDETVTFPPAWTDAQYVWKAALPGVGHSSPAAWGDLVVVTSGDESTGELIVTALNLDDGAVLWGKRLPGIAYKHHPSNSLASSTPALDAERIYVTWMGAEGVRAAALSYQGEVVWEMLVGPFVEQNGYGPSPIVVDGLLILAHDSESESFLLAVDKGSGKTRWKLPRKSGNPSYSTPVVWEASDGTAQVIVQSTSEGMAGVRLASGELLWQVADAFADRCVASPIVWKDRAFGSCGRGGNGSILVCVQPTEDAGGTPRTAYSLRKSVPQVPTTLAYRDLLFVWHDRGVVSCCDPMTGKAYWQERIGGNFFGSPVCAGGTLYGVSSTGEVVAIAADKEFLLLGRSQLGEASHASPAIQKGRLLFRTLSGVVCLKEGERG